LPREEEESKSDGSITSGVPAAFRGEGANVRASRTSVTDNARDRRDAHRGSKEPSIPTAITAAATPQQQFVERDVAIIGRLTANGAPVAGGLVKLYSDDEGLWYNISSTTTDTHGGFVFAVQQPTSGTRVFKVAYPGTGTHEPCVSDDLSVNYVILPASITATATFQKQFVGQSVTIAGVLTANDFPVAGASITLYKSDDVTGQAALAATTTDASGHYQFVVTDAAPGEHCYVVNALGTSTRAAAKSSEIAVTFTIVPTTVTATATPRQQFVGHDVTITGRLLADDSAVAGASITLYNADDIIERVPVDATVTDASGFYQFALTGTSAGQHSYVVHTPRTTMHSQALSDKLWVSYVTVPTTITATATPRQQFVGQDVTIAGQLTALGVEPAGVSVVLYVVDDPTKMVCTATTVTGASGDYRFTVAESVAATHAYTVCVEESVTLSRAQSPEILVTWARGEAAPVAISETPVVITPEAPVVVREAPVVITPEAPVVVREAPVVITPEAPVVVREAPVVITAEAPVAISEAPFAVAEAPVVITPEAPVVVTRLALNLTWYELLSIAFIIVGEGLLFANYRVFGVGVQALNVVAVAIMVAVLHEERLQLVEALALVSVFRVFNLSFALVPTVTLYWFVIVYGVMYVPIILIIIHEKMSRSDLGIDNVRRSVLLLPLGVAIGIGFALIERLIIANQVVVIPNFSATGIIQLSIVMIFFVAVVEELLFRVLLQPQLIGRSGAVVGILLTSVIFGAMHSGYANAYELLFATAAGVVLGVAFYKTKNLPLVVTIHAVDNIVLFGAPVLFAHLVATY
jgi:hypothetical protein